MIIGINGYAGVGKDCVGTLIQYVKCYKGNKLSMDELISDEKYLQSWMTEKDFIEKQSGWKIKKWAGKLKTIATILTGIPEERFEDQEFKKTFLGPKWDSYGIIRKDSARQVAVQSQPHDQDSHWLHNPGNRQVHNQMTVRDFLQKLGTDALRDGLHPNTWINALMSEYNPYSTRGSFYEEVESNWIITDTRFPNEAQAIKDAGGIVIRVDRPGFKPVNAHPSETGLDHWDFDYKIMNGSDLVSLAFTVKNIMEKENYV